MTAFTQQPVDPALTVDRLGATTAMGAVTLYVADLDGMVAYYRDGVRLDLLRQEGASAVLGRQAPGRAPEPVVVLEHSPTLAAATPGSAGLFHVAVLYEQRADLAASVLSLAEKYPQTYVANQDHLVSQAFYFTDPEGNGVELYWDRDRADWDWVDGQVQMDNLAFDPNAFVTSHVDEAAVRDAQVRPASVGHVHLSVGDIDTARDFYVSTLGFAQTFVMHGTALFVSAGGYHHHMAMNVWNSRGAGLRAPALGLGLVRIALPDRQAIDHVVERMRDHGVDTRDEGATVSFDDPWANRIELSVTG
ncbi:VOC family protein [Brevibacterium litoralis]|uniref:VOC family protein n=1 Tax=Brevibacterium litoralis TaxID=3138935 RepID=UPI0032EE0A45